MTIDDHVPATDTGDPPVTASISQADFNKRLQEFKDNETKALEQQEVLRIQELLKMVGNGAQYDSENENLFMVGDQLVEAVLAQIRQKIKDINQLISEKAELDRIQDKMLQNQDENVIKSFGDLKDTIDKNLCSRTQFEQDQKIQYLVWEPRSLVNKLEAVFVNSMETLYVLSVALLSIWLSSVVSIGCFIFSLILFFTMTMSQTKRFFYGQIVLGTKLLLVMGVVIWKLVKIKAMIHSSTSQEQFKYEIRFYECLGFSLEYDKELLSKLTKATQFKYNHQLLESFLCEIFIGFLILLFVRMMRKQVKTIEYLMDEKNFKNIKDKIDLEKKLFGSESENESDSLDTEKNEIKNREDQVKKKRDQDENNEKLEELNKQVPECYLDCGWFYNQNQRFFVLSLLSLLFEAMNFNSLSDIPPLFLLLLMFAFYGVRKQYSIIYRNFTFFIMYFNQLTLVLKLINDMLINIAFIRSFIKHNKDSLIVSFNDLVFGGTGEVELQSQRLYYFLSVFAGIYFQQSWKTTKWIEIRFKTYKFEDQSFVTRFFEYFKEREQQDKDILKLTQMLSQNRSSKADSELKRILKEIEMTKGKFDSGGSSISKASKDFTPYLPVVVMWLCRLTMFVLGYKYHAEISLVHILWIILSFLIDFKSIILLSIVVMIPLLSWEFVLIYGMGIKKVAETEFFKNYGFYFQWTMKNQVLEQAVMFLNLALFYTLISCYMILKPDEHNKLLDFFVRKITEPRQSHIWKVLFFACRYIQTAVLLILFLYGVGEINQLKNLGFMIFFVIYSAYEEVYRKTSFILLIFISGFIISQYFLTFYYQIFSNNDNLMSRLRWLSLFPSNKYSTQDPFGIKDNHDIYWRIPIPYIDWLILIMMSLLVDLNTMFQYREEVALLSEKATSILEDQYSKTLYYTRRIENIFKGLFIYLVLVVMILINCYLEVNLINWIFFILNTVNLGYMIIGNYSITKIYRIKFFANCIKFYSLVILITDILFICFIGESEKKGQPDSLDQRIKKRYPIFYQYIDVVGFRSTEGGSGVLRHKFIAYVLFFLLGIYLVNHFKSILKLKIGEKEFTEKEYYSRLFQYNDQEASPSNLKSFKSLINSQASIDIDPIDGNIFKKKDVYSSRDLIAFYEKTRFTVPFIVYRFMDYWPFFDFLASYGHIVNNLLIVLVSINYSVSIFTCFNILCVCLFYMLATIRLNYKSFRNFQQSGLQSSCDIKMATLITKRYKQESFIVFLQIRRQIWHIQFFMLCFLICIGYPTNLLQKVRNQLTDEADIKKLDSLSFWLFIIGIYKDSRPESSKHYVITFLAFTIGLIIERQAISWLKNRFGCSYYKLQKFVELDFRREGLRQNWEVRPPHYNPEHYKQHYFYHDFEKLVEQFNNNYEFIEKTNRSKDMFGNDQYGDFVPHKIGRRIKETIKFKILLDSHAPELNLDDDTKIKLQKLYLKQDNFEYESFPVLRRHKEKFLGMILKEAVDRKYKISLQKGMQMLLETLMILLLMISLVMKANFFSIIYLVFIIRFAQMSTKTGLLVRLNSYMSICLFIQYTIYLLNLNYHTSPSPFPSPYETYPFDSQTQTIKLIYPIPLFFRYEIFNNLRFAYLLGVGVDKDQLNILIIDFFNIFLVSVYILHFRNPILRKDLKKIFWQFPSMDDHKQLGRVVKYDLGENKNLLRQLRWLHKPIEFSEDSVLLEERQNVKLKDFEYQYSFGMQYFQMKSYDLNQILKNYVDLKFDHIWDSKFLKEKKFEIKSTSIYFRIVKQGSVLVYITFHIFTILIVLLMATMRKSMLSLGYVLILLPHIKRSAEVLDQRAINMNMTKSQLDREIEEMKEKLEELKKRSNQDQKIQNLRKDIKKKENELKELSKRDKGKVISQKFKERKFKDQTQWKMIPVIKYSLLFWALIDLIIQILLQLSIFDTFSNQDAGFRKIWQVNKRYENDADRNVFNLYYFLSQEHPPTLDFNSFNYFMQILNCVIVSIIILQSEIFDSYGFQKYVTQKDGSMDLLIQLSELKGQAMAYVFNNKKIRQIVSVQRKKETIDQTVEKVRQKLIKWRLQQKSVLSNKEREVDDSDAFRRVSRTMTENDLRGMRRNTSKVNNDFVRSKDEPSDSRINSLSEKNRQEIKGKTKEVNFEEIEHVKIKEEDRQQIHRILANELVKSKMKKMSACLRFYNWLNETFTEQIMFKNRREDLEQIKKSIAAGEVKVRTELERLMYVEAKEMIRNHYDNTEGENELKYLINRRLDKSPHSLLNLTHFDRKIQLQQMERTWEFTRPWQMVIHYFETIFYIMISHTQNFIYFSMILSMYMNAGIISIFYPISIFGYALLEETRPRKYFWTIVRRYTTFLLLFKMIGNLSIFYKELNSEPFKFYAALLKIGIYNYDSILDITLYMIPEILIISFIQLNEIKLKLIGLYYSVETDIESVLEGIQRNLEKGDEEKVRHKRIEASNMCMSRYYESIHQQNKRLISAIEQRALEIEKELLDQRIEKEQLQESYGSTSYNECSLIIARQEFESQDKQKTQLQTIYQLSSKIQKSSREFDLDTTAKKSQLDLLVEMNVIQKTLEQDNLIYVEGKKDVGKNQLITSEQLHKDLKLPENWEELSACDYQLEFDHKFEVIDDRKKPKMGLFERQPYFDKIFPSLKIQKPGYDLYGSTTVILSLIAIFIFLFYNNLTVDPSVFKFVRGQTSLFSGGMAVDLIFIIFFIVVERYANRTDTKAVNQQRKNNREVLSGSNSFFSQDEIFSRTDTTRQFTVRIKTQKTSDLDIQGNSAQQFLQQMYGQENTIQKFDESRTKITSQQKTKYVLHWVFLIAAHFYIFWLIPISANFKLYGSPECQQKTKDFYGCMNFEENIYLRILYILIVFYLILSSFQLSYGFPIMKKPSSVLQYYNDGAKLLADIYVSIPFALELRCLLDFTMSKTSLDVFQFFQLFQYHYETYGPKVGNRSYTVKTLGSKTTQLDKCIFGWLISSIIMFMLVGPFLFFSEYGGLVQPNPVIDGAFQLSLNINKTICTNSSSGDIIPNIKCQLLQNMNRTDEVILTNSSVSSTIFSQNHPFLATFSDKMFQTSNYSKWTETRFFEAKQIQECVIYSYSDQAWVISQAQENQLKADIETSVNKNLSILHGNVSFIFNFQFTRDLPETDKKASTRVERTLNYSRYFDCRTGKQLHNFTQMNCKQNPNQSVQIKIAQAIPANLILGQTANVGVITREGDNLLDQVNDILLEYSCQTRTWKAQTKDKPSYYDKYISTAPVDPKTCEFLDQGPFIKPKIDDQNIQEEKDMEKKNSPWKLIRLTLFSMLVSSSILASYNPTTFFSAIAYGLSTVLRPALIFGSWKGWIYECTDPAPVIKVIEQVYIKRHEEDLVGEEEAFRILLEIMRTPDLYKAITGSSLKGSTDPILDKLDQGAREKILHLEKLEQKGFEVSLLKKKLLKSRKNKGDMHFD